MKLAKYQTPNGDDAVGIIDHDQLNPLDLSDGAYSSLADILESEDPAATANSLSQNTETIPLASASLLAPIDQQEVWAAGVTYKRSKNARMEESETAASCYDRVYESPRPEIFFKATPSRVSGPGQPVRIRVDSTWNVPEPEVCVVLNSRHQIVGFTVGNDMSSRDIEGENPLYLPQAKVYNQCCGLGPWITLATAMPPREATAIQLTIRRDNEIAFSGESAIDQMARTFEDLVSWLTRDNNLIHGAFLLTGTGIVPDSDFTLHPGDLVEISVEGIGTLSNTVVQG